MGTELVTAYLALGSNMGDRQKNLDGALDFLSHRLRMGKTSSTYETDAVDNTDQPRFLNLVCEVFTRLAPEALLVLAKGIESKMGRTGKSGDPRPIDIDILFHGAQVMETPELVIPHPRIAERAFVLIPLVEIAPNLVHPPSGKTIKEILHGLREVQEVFRWHAS